MVGMMGDTDCACEEACDLFVLVLGVVQVNVQKWGWSVMMMMCKIPRVPRYSRPPWGRDKTVRNRKKTTTIQNVSNYLVAKPGYSHNGKIRNSNITLTFQDIILENNEHRVRNGIHVRFTSKLSKFDIRQDQNTTVLATILRWSRVSQHVWLRTS